MLPTIVGGNAAKKGNWGWQVRLSGDGYFCGGSLIASQWVFFFSIILI